MGGSRRLATTAALSCLLATACGRWGFDPTPDAAVDAAPDASPDAALPAVFVTTLDETSTTSATNGSITLQVPTAVPIGRRVLVAFSPGSMLGAFMCTDTAGNAYVIEATAGSGGTSVVGVCSTVTSAVLAAGAMITVTYPAFSGISVALAVELAVNAPGPRDQLAVATANSPRPMTGAAGATSQPNEILAALIAWSGIADLTTLVGYYTVAAVDTDSGTMTHNLVLGLREVTQIGTYEVEGTLSSPSQWKALLLTYPR